jgi:MinD superfamily P-loop ATPase containing an inserted ferredoxin domain
MATVKRKIVHIDEDKCNGCGVCVHACHEGAIQMVNGKAKLVSDVYCDGLGDCLGPCPTGAISIVTREAEEYDDNAVKERMAAKEQSGPLPCGCPGSMARTLKKEAAPARQEASCSCSCESQLMNWPVQLQLVPAGAPYLRGADIVLAADCVPVAVPDFHARYLRNKPVIIACPKLDDNAAQIAKLAEIIRTSKPSSITVVRMEVPCCGGLVRVAEEAVRESGENTRVDTIIVGADGSEK